MDYGFVHKEDYLQATRDGTNKMRSRSANANIEKR